MSWCGGGEINPTPAVVPRTLAIGAISSLPLFAHDGKPPGLVSARFCWASSRFASSIALGSRCRDHHPRNRHRGLRRNRHAEPGSRWTADRLRSLNLPRELSSFASNNARRLPGVEAQQGMISTARPLARTNRAIFSRPLVRRRSPVTPATGDPRGQGSFA